MRIKTNSQTEVPPNLMPLIDMVFLLLIFFLVATTFEQEERDANVKLAVASRKINPMSAPPQQLIINILHDGSLTVSGRPITRKELVNRLLNLVRNEPGRDVVVRVDERSIHMYYAWVVRTARECGITSSRLTYLIQDPKKTVAG